MGVRCKKNVTLRAREIVNILQHKTTQKMSYNFNTKLVFHPHGRLPHHVRWFLAKFSSSRSSDLAAEVTNGKAGRGITIIALTHIQLTAELVIFKAGRGITIIELSHIQLTATIN